MRVLAVAAALLLGAWTPAAAQYDTRPSFTEWLAGVRSEALARGVREEVLDQALGNITEPEPTVIERDRSRPRRS